jgi:general secretion pathway protein G
VKSSPRSLPPRLASGFTLIEVLIVMVIITILAGIGLAMYNNSVIRAREAVLKEDLFQMREAIDQYYADKNKWPPTLDALVTEKYIRKIPDDPITGTADWRTTFGEPDPGNPAAEAGISDVHSATSEVSPLTGTPYSEW